MVINVSFCKIFLVPPKDIEKNRVLPWQKKDQASYQEQAYFLQNFIGRG
jgi:hypothetical protein